jgi:hypothetical protein
MARKKKNEATNVASSRVSGWAIVLTWERPDGTWYTETRTEIPDDVAQTVDMYITELENEKKE